MRSLITVFLLFISTISFTLADYSVTYPGTGSVLKKGTQVTVQWTVTKATDTLVNVILAKGPASNLQTVLYLCKDINPQAGKCTFTVGSLTSDVDYAIIVGKDPNHYGYSSFFSIQSNGPLPEAKGCPNFGGQNCPSSLPCCSSSGYCGASAEHCGTGCVAKFSFNGQCKEPGSSGSTKPAQTTKTTQTTKPTQSSNNLCGSVKCTSDLPCCSEYNYCGASSSHCGTGCQPGKSFGGKCLIPNSTTTSKPKQQTCGGKMCNKKNPCCYKNQKCGNTKSFCAAGCQKQRSFNGKCQLK